jgi:hypothetical protein
MRLTHAVRLRVGHGFGVILMCLQGRCKTAMISCASETRQHHIMRGYAAGSFSHTTKGASRSIWADAAKKGKHGHANVLV